PEYATSVSLPQRVYPVAGAQLGSRGGRRGGGFRGEPPPGRGEPPPGRGPFSGSDEPPGRRGNQPGQPSAQTILANFDLSVLPVYQKVVQSHRAEWVEPQPVALLPGQMVAQYCTPILSGEKMIGVVAALVQVNAGNFNQDPRFNQGRPAGRGGRGGF